jgi:hypothetical protein
LEQVETKGMSQPVLGERSRLTDTYENSKDFLRDIAKQNFLFLLMEDGTIMNGHWDVTETKEFLEGIRTGQEEVRLKDYLVYRPIPKAILALRDKPDVHPESYEMQLYYTKLMKVMKEGIYIGQNTTILCFVLGDHVYFEIPVR